MPILSRFYGIVVFMNYNHHEPPHFHARYQDREIRVEIHSGLVRGIMSKRELRLVLEWADANHEKLSENWVRARQRKPLEPIDPLP